jgi:hypothetical protein
LRHPLFTRGGFAGVGIDYRWNMSEALDHFSAVSYKATRSALLLCERDELRKHLDRYLEPLADRARRLGLWIGPWCVCPRLKKM